MPLAAVPRSSVLPVVTTDDLLRDVLAEIRGLREDMRAARPSLNLDDRAALARILPAVAGAYGETAFTSRDLFDDPSPAVHFVVKGLSAKSIGKLLARAEGTPIAGLMVVRDGRAINVTQWRIVAC
jgi:hypothetical protein